MSCRCQLEIENKGIELGGDSKAVCEISTKTPLPHGSYGGLCSIGGSGLPPSCVAVTSIVRDSYRGSRAVTVATCDTILALRRLNVLQFLYSFRPSDASLARAFRRNFSTLFTRTLF